MTTVGDTIALMRQLSQCLVGRMMLNLVVGFGILIVAGVD